MIKKFREYSVYVIPVLAVLGLSMTLGSVFMKPKPLSKLPVVMPPQNFYPSAVSGIGVVEPKSGNINVGVEISGIVRSIPVEVGQTVKKGDILFALDQRDIDATIEVLEHTLHSAQVAADQAVAKFALVENITNTKAIAQDEYNDRMYNKALALAQVKIIEANIRQALKTKERLTVYAPMDGEVIEINVHLGEYAQNGQVMMRFGDTSTLYVRVEIDEEYASDVHPNNPAYGVKRNNPGRKVPLKFVSFEPWVQPKTNLAVAGQRVDTRVLRIIYALPEESDLFVGQQMDVYIEKEKYNTQDDKDKDQQKKSGVHT